MLEVVNQTTNRGRKKKADSEFAAMNNPFAVQSEQIINESLDDSSKQSDFIVPENAIDDDWLEGLDNVEIKSQSPGENVYVPIDEDGVFAFNYKESNTIILRPYPIISTKHEAISNFTVTGTLINDPGGEEPIFNETSPRTLGANAKDIVFTKMMSLLKGDDTLKKQTVRTIINKYILCQILGNKANPETVGKFVLFRISYTLNKIMEENGIIDALGELVKPGSNKAIVINMTYDESRAKRIEYNVNIQTYNTGEDKLVATTSNTYKNVGVDMNAYHAWKQQFYSETGRLFKTYAKLCEYDKNHFTPQYADEIVAKFRARYNEVNTVMNVSAETAAESISQEISNPFGGKSESSNPFGGSASTFTDNPFVSNMNNNPFGASPKNGGFGDL